jgi:hypothetical protein
MIGQPSQPAGRPNFLLLPGENQALAYRTEHLDAEGLITGNQVQPTLVGETGGNHGLFVQCRDDLAVHRLELPFSIDHTVFQRFEYPTQAIAGEFIGVTYTRAQRRIGAGELDKKSSTAAIGEQA